MDSARLPDADLLQLVREGGETAPPALRELEQRHFHAVKAFASACAVNLSAGSQLANQAWQRALRSQEGSAIGAVRPHALTVVLRSAADFAGTGHRSALDFDLAVWLEPYLPQFPSGAPGLNPAFFHRDSVTAQAFGALPGSSQTVLWHYTVEHDDGVWIRGLLGSGTEDVSLLNRRARRELYDAYVQIHQDETLDDECRRFHRMVLAYAEQRCMNPAADVIPHLERCAYCSRAVTDLGRMRADCGGLLAESLLPWGGQEYAASRFPTAFSSTLQVPDGVVEVSHPVTEQLPVVARERGRRRAAGAGAAVAALSLGRNRNRHDDEREERIPRERRLSGRRVAQSVAVLGLCSVAVAFAYAGGVGPGTQQSSDSAPPKEVPEAPAPSKPSPSKTTATATATSTVTATKSPKPPPTGGGGQSSSAPPVRGAALEWVFDGVKRGVAADTSGENQDGTLIGDPLPRLLKSGAVQFFGVQSVAADGPVVDTTGSFSVSARVKLQDDEEFQTVVSQDGTEISGFQLQYDPEEDRWEMRMAEEDDEDSDADEASSETDPEVGVWTHLTGVYDGSEDEIRLYVDGVLEDTTDREGGFDAEGDFAAGRALEGDEFVRGFEGTVDDVRVFPKAVSGAEAVKLARGR
ncbi:LamG domain-containing protein [Streptomyces albidus (ex Kaewkla and Franco 2022)]|uniref:LamG domain-containing protein n=1 Tax=Streptomyces albidus (ex Kaewkla and Franco 2022) TaxID=722709 RepID=UPI0015EF0FB5|nr:LamG domain-containing protein [Streptomyces albidus (ex Kaewkla and Franco 2022)]